MGERTGGGFLTTDKIIWLFVSEQWTPIGVAFCRLIRAWQASSTRTSHSKQHYKLLFPLWMTVLHEAMEETRNCLCLHLALLARWKLISIRIIASSSFASLYKTIRNGCRKGRVLIYGKHHWCTVPKIRHDDREFSSNPKQYVSFPVGVTSETARFCKPAGRPGSFNIYQFDGKISRILIKDGDN